VKIKFCEFTCEQKGSLNQVFNSIYKLDDFEIISSIYEVFKKDFPGPTISSAQNIPRDKIQPRTDQNNILADFNNINFQIGIDLPVLLCPEKKSTKTLFIVGEDPLRDFVDLSSDVRLSTPFGLHMEEFRNYRLPLYWQYIEYLLGQGFNVYVTDYIKLWVKRKDKLKINFKDDMEENFQKAFICELEAFNPQLIVTFGNCASSLLNKASDKINSYGISSINFPHPTGTANGKWKNEFKKYYSRVDISCTNENKLNYMKSRTNAL
jgi:hypothetical protein